MIEGTNKEVASGIMYNFGAYNKWDNNEQWIRITEGCPHNHDYCYEPTRIKLLGIPKLIRNKVKIMDMNLLCKPEALEIINFLGSQKVDNKVVYFELICGIDFRFLTLEIAEAMKNARFKNIRLAWDGSFADQKRIKEAVLLLKDAGYRSHKHCEITIFIICNWKISFEDCCKKMDLCKIYGVKISDCYYDNQTSPNFKSIYWTTNEMKKFRKMVRKHNQLVTFGIDPEYKD